MKKISTTLLLVLLILSLTLSTACSDSDKKITSDTDNGTEDNSGEFTPVDGLDFGGKNFTILVPADNGWSQYDDFSATEVTGEAVNDANLKKMQKLEEIYNVKIVNKVASQSSVVEEARSDIQANLNTYDAILAEMCENGGISTLAEEGLLQDLKALDNIDLSKPWYSQNAVNNLSMSNKLFYVMGDISTVDNDGISALSFNKKLLNDAQLDNPYTLVKENKWTLDNFYSLCKDFYMDLNGNGDIDADDRFGLLTDNENTLYFMIGGGMQIVNKDADDKPVLSVYNDRNATMFSKVLNIVTDNNTTQRLENLNLTDGSDIYQYGSTMFMNDQILFRLTAMYRIIECRKMDSDFGILPLPKYDENQEGYYHLLSYASPAIAIPVTALDPEKNAAVIDALSYYGRSIVLPEYYDRVLQGQVSRDEESQDMLDIIFDSAYFDLGIIHNFGGIRGIFGAMTATGSDTFASEYAALETVANKSIDRIIKQYDKLG